MATIELLYDTGEWNNYVYDLEVDHEDHNFQAGDGDIIAYKLI